MDWMTQVDGYCERNGPGLWAEPVNAVTNLAFIGVALFMWPRTRGLPMACALCIVMVVIGVGSGLFHTVATRWASLADTFPILVFILLYIYAATRDFWKAPRWGSWLAVVLFVPVSVLLMPVFRSLPLYGVSAGYMAVPLMIAGYAIGLARRVPATARGLGIGAVLLMVSLTFRSVDEMVCTITRGLGTHFLWHICNAAMLGWMIEVYRRHMLAGAAPGR